MTIKITKKELKQPDSFQRLVAKVSEFIFDHKRKFYIAAAAVLIILFMSAGWYLYMQHTEKKAQLLYTKAYLASIKSGQNGNQLDETSLKLYQDVVSKYPGTKVAAIANYHIGNIYYRINEIEKAMKAYQECLKKSSGNSDLVRLVYISIGYCYESKKELAKAIYSFEKAMQIKSADNDASTNLRDIARIYEKQNNKTKALEYYKKALEKTDDLFLSQYIKKKISVIE
jgi:tetratricopeptide (TPR) repeat protein